MNFATINFVAQNIESKITELMKKLFLYCFLIFCFSGLNGFAQSNENGTIDQKSAEITFEKELHDYGTIDYSGDGVYYFKFTNTGKEPLVISNATGSCGCTVPQWPKEPILKGQSANLKVSYDTKRPGPFTKTVTVTSNAKTTSKVLTIKGVVKSQEQTDDQTPVNKTKGMSPLAAPGN